MVDGDIKALYDEVIKYLTATHGYLTDPETPEAPITDLEDLDLTSAISTIQKQVTAAASIGEAATIKAYRDIESVGHETAIRKMKRSDYWTDSGVEAQDNIDKWLYNQKLINLHQNGKDAGA